MASFPNYILSNAPEGKVLTREQAARSLVVTNIAPQTTDEDIVIYFQRQRNGGGEISHVHIPRKGTAVVTFDENEVAARVLEHHHTLDGSNLKLCPFIPTEARQVFKEVKARVCFESIHLLPRQSEDILEIVKENTGVELEYRKDTEVVFMTGTFDQIEAAHKLLQCLVSQQMKREKKVASYGDIDDFSKFEVQPLFMKLLKRVLNKKLQEIEGKSCVKIRCDENMSQVFIRPSKITAKQNHFQEGCDAFIDLYQKFIPNIGREEVTPPKDADTAFIQEAVTTAEAENPMIIEKTEGLLLVYAEKKSMKRSVQSLKEELGLTIDKDGKKAKPRQGNRRVDARSENEIPQQGQLSLTQHLKHELSNEVKLSLYQGDITDERVDAIVNAANEWLRHGGGVAAAIVSKGGRQIQVESTWIVQKYGPLDVGRATYTYAGNLPCRYVIHTVGPEWRKHGKDNCKHFLHKACMESLHIAAVDLELSSIALTAISSGIFGMPKEICAQIMLSAVEAFSSSEEAEFSTLRDVRIVIIDEPTLSVFQEEFVKRYLSQEPSPETMATRESLPDEHRLTPPTPHSPVYKPEDSSSLTDQTQGGDKNSVRGQREENIDGSSPPNNLPNNKNSSNVTVSGGMKQNLKNDNVSQSSNESSNVGNDRGENGDVSAVDKRNDSSLLRDETQSGDENNLLVGERQENRDGKLQLDNVQKAENSADSTATSNVNGGSSPHQANEHLKKPRGPASVNEAPNKENGNESSSVEGLVNSNGGNVGKYVFGKGRGNFAPNFQNSPGKERSATTNGNTYLESASTRHGRGRGFATTFSPLELDMTKEGKHLAHLHEMREGGNENEGKVSESQRSGMVQNPKCNNQDSDACNPVDTSRAIPTENHVTDESHIINHQGLKNSLPVGETIPNQCESSLQSEGCANDGSEESTFAENTENAKPNGELPTTDHDESSQDRLTVPPKDTMMQEAFKSSAQGQFLPSGMKVQNRKSGPNCLMCMENNDPVYPSKCGRDHYYCTSCIKHFHEETPICPQCQRESLRQGNQPIGWMTWETVTENYLPGYEGCDVILMYFKFEEGIQGPEHPNPGRPYSPLNTSAFLPQNSEGKEICDLLQRAFNAGLLFTIGTSPATGEENNIIWNDIELKTSQSGGPASYGYPDPSYIDRVKKQLAEKGITSSYKNGNSTTNLDFHV